MVKLILAAQLTYAVECSNIKVQDTYNLSVEVGYALVFLNTGGGGAATWLLKRHPALSRPAKA